MVKLTKRKGFNFFRSYYDVYNELNDSDKVAFIDALLDRQFLGKKPTNLTGMAKFAYISQTNSIDSQVKGYNDKAKSLGRPVLGDNNPPPVGGAYGGGEPPAGQEKEKEKEKGQYVYTKKEFLIDWNKLRKEHLKKPSHLNTIPYSDIDLLKNLLKDNSIEDVRNAMIGLFKQKKMPNGQTTMQSNPSHFLKFFNSYLTAYHDKNDNLYGKPE